MNLDVTQTITVDDLVLDPCPYFHVKNVLPIGIYNQLVSEYPEKYILEDGKIFFQARRYCPHEFIEGSITPLWKEFIEFHSGQIYKDRVLSLFEPALEKYYKDSIDEFKSSKVTLRHSGEKNKIQMEVQFVLNGQQSETVRTAHLDNTRELFAGLLYMRYSNDNSKGGDFQIFKSTVKNPDFYEGTREVNISQVEVAKTIPYAENSMVLFLNTKDTLHGVTPRLGASTYRRYVNIDAHQDKKLFKV